jgi:hypothetical protein
VSSSSSFQSSDAALEKLAGLGREKILGLMGKILASRTAVDAIKSQYMH